VELKMPYYRASIKEYSVKKTLTIPGWLNGIAEQNKINFSKLFLLKKLYVLRNQKQGIL